MKPNKNKLHCVSTIADLTLLISLYINKISGTLNPSFESIVATRMYCYKFEQNYDLKSLRLRINPYLVFFENQITSENLVLNKGLCVMYPSTLVTGKIESHVKFVGKSGILLYEWFKQDKTSSYGIDEIIAMLTSISDKTDTKVTVQNVKRIIELLIIDLFLIIE